MVVPGAWWENTTRACRTTPSAPFQETLQWHQATDSVVHPGSFIQCTCLLFILQYDAICPSVPYDTLELFFVGFDLIMIAQLSRVPVQEGATHVAISWVLQHQMLPYINNHFRVYIGGTYHISALRKGYVERNIPKIYYKGKKHSSSTSGCWNSEKIK